MGSDTNGAEEPPAGERDRATKSVLLQPVTLALLDAAYPHDPHMTDKIRHAAVDGLRLRTAREYTIDRRHEPPDTDGDAKSLSVGFEPATIDTITDAYPDALTDPRKIRWAIQDGLDYRLAESVTIRGSE